MAARGGDVATKDLRRKYGADPARLLLHRNYDMLNQPAPSANNTFTPTNKRRAHGPTSILPVRRELVRRMEMSGTACSMLYRESQRLHQVQRELYEGSPPLRKNALECQRPARLARNAATQVEGQPFDAWFEQQFVLDTSGTLATRYTPTHAASSPTQRGGCDTAEWRSIDITTDHLLRRCEKDLSGHLAGWSYWGLPISRTALLRRRFRPVLSNGFGTVSPTSARTGADRPARSRTSCVSPSDLPVKKSMSVSISRQDRQERATKPNEFSPDVVAGADAASIVRPVRSGRDLANIPDDGFARGEFGAESNTGKRGGHDQRGVSLRTTLSFSGPGKTAPTPTSATSMVRPGDLLVLPGRARGNATHAIHNIPYPARR